MSSHPRDLEEFNLAAFKERLHPRDREGKFKEKVGALAPGQSASTLAGTRVHRDKSGDYYVKRKGGKSQKVKTADEAAKAARSAEKEDLGVKRHILRAKNALGAAAVAAATVAPEIAHKFEKLELKLGQGGVDSVKAALKSLKKEIPNHMDEVVEFANIAMNLLAAAEQEEVPLRVKLVEARRERIEAEARGDSRAFTLALARERALKERLGV